MLHLYLTAQAVTTSDEENDLQVYLLLSGIDYFNSNFEVNSEINYNFHITRSDETSGEARKGNGERTCQQVTTTTMNISF